MLTLMIAWIGFTVASLTLAIMIYFERPYLGFKPRRYYWTCPVCRVEWIYFGAIGMIRARWIRRCWDDRRADHRTEE